MESNISETRLSLKTPNKPEPNSQSSQSSNNGRKPKTPNTILRQQQQHRENERSRHQGLNATMNEVAAMVPGYSAKETKIVTMRRMISYIFYLEDYISNLMNELKLDTDAKALFLTERVSPEEISPWPSPDKQKQRSNKSDEEPDEPTTKEVPLRKDRSQVVPSFPSNQEGLTVVLYPDVNTCNTCAHQIARSQRQRNVPRRIQPKIKTNERAFSTPPSSIPLAVYNLYKNQGANATKRRETTGTYHHQLVHDGVVSIDGKPSNIYKAQERGRRKYVRMAPRNNVGRPKLKPKPCADIKSDKNLTLTGRLKVQSKGSIENCLEPKQDSQAALGSAHQSKSAIQSNSVSGANCAKIGPPVWLCKASNRGRKRKLTREKSPEDSFAIAPEVSDSEGKENYNVMKEEAEDPLLNIHEGVELSVPDVSDIDLNVCDSNLWSLDFFTTDIGSLELPELGDQFFPEN